MRRRAPPPRLDGILAGSEEPVFRVLPQRVLEDMRRPMPGDPWDGRQGLSILGD